MFFILTLAANKVKIGIKFFFILGQQALKILVPIKRVIDAYVRIRVKPDKSAVDTDLVKMSMNPFDEIAIEEALRIKEKNPEQHHEIILVSIGNTQCQETLRNGLALGADRAIFVETEATLDPLIIANVLKQIVEQESIQLALLGKQAIDYDNNQTGQMLAALLNWPQATFASKISVENNKATVTREIDGGLETLLLHLPAVITTDLRLNQPRYATLPNIMKAKTKPLQKVALGSFNVAVENTITILSVEPPPERKAGIMVDSVNDLIDKLKNVEQVI